MDFNLKLLLIQVPVILFSLTIHEFSHAWVAYLLGDDTAKRQRRLTLNPLVHLDFVGTVLMFLAGFGWAKSVPVNYLNFKNPKRGLLIVALAGPLSNLLTAFVAGFTLRILVPLAVGSSVIPGVVAVSLVVVILMLQYGIALAVFNMIPLPPLDGSRVLYGLLPSKQADSYSRLEPYGVMILFALFVFGGKLFSHILWYPVSLLTFLFSGHDYFQLSSIIYYIAS